MRRPIRSTVLLAAFAFAFAFAGTPHAQSSYPDKLVRVIVPYPPGGTTDTNARFVTRHLSEALGQQFVVEYRPGANGSIGAALVARSANDGYTLLYGGSISTLVVNPLIYKDVGYAEGSLVPVIPVTDMSTILIVRPDAPFTDVQGLVDYARKNPGKLNFGSAGYGNVAHLSAELFMQQTGTQITHVPYKGGAGAMMGMLGGEVDLLFNTPIEVLPHIRAGKVRALATLGKHRLAILPDLPTMQEAGVDAQISTWSGFMAPAGTPAAVLEKLNTAIAEVMTTPEAKTMLQELGIDFPGGSVEETAELLKEGRPHWKRLVDRANISPM